MNSCLSQVWDSNTLQVVIQVVIEGRNLASKDSNGLSDPFVTIKLGKIKHSTRIVYKTLNPVFADESYSFSSIIDGAHNMLKIQCWDHDTVKNDFMGRVDVPMCDIQTEIKFKSPTGNGYFQRWYQLKSRGKLHIDGTITGDLLLKFEIVGVKQIPTALSRIPSGPVHAGARLVMLLQQSHLDITSLISVGSALKLDTRLQGICISLGALSLLKMHLTYNINSVPVLLGILRILVTMTTLEEAKEKMVELGFMCELYDVVKHHAIDRSTILLYADWTQLLLNLSDYYELKVTLLISIVSSPYPNTRDTSLPLHHCLSL